MNTFSFNGFKCGCDFRRGKRNCLKCYDKTSKVVVMSDMSVQPPESHFVFDTLRAFQFATLWSTALTQHREKLKLEVIWNIEKGQI